MTAAVVRRYGPPHVVEVGELPTPLPAAGQVLVRVRAASLNPLDTKLRSGALRPFLRLKFPAVLGFDFAGEIAALGAGVSGWSIGDRAYGRTDAKTGGTHAELAPVAAKVIDRIPARLSFEQAAALPLTGTTALQALQQVELKAGQRLLVNGAAGGVGSLAVQIGRALGASVTGVASTASAPLMARLGVPMLDYTTGDVERTEEPFDVVFDTVFDRRWRDFARLLAPRGTYITTGFSPRLAARASFGRLLSRQRFTFVVSRADGRRMRELSRLVDAGKLAPVIDATFPLERAAFGHERVETGHVHGKLVLTIP